MTRPANDTTDPTSAHRDRAQTHLLTADSMLDAARRAVCAALSAAHNGTGLGDELLEALTHLEAAQHDVDAARGELSAHLIPARVAG